MPSDRAANVTQTEWDKQKQNLNNAKRRKPTDVYLPVVFTQDVEIQYAFYVKYFYNISLAPSELQRHSAAKYREKKINF
jgi:hypothetical protein